MHNAVDRSALVAAEFFEASGVTWARLIRKADAWIEREVDEKGRVVRYAESTYVTAAEWERSRRR